MSEESRLASNAAIALAGTIGSAVLAMLYVSLGARWLGPLQYGGVGATIALANVLFLALSPIESGIALKVAALKGAGDGIAIREFANLSTRGLALAALLLVSLWLAFSPLIGTIVEAQDSVAFAWLGAFFAGSLVCCVPRGVMRGREQFRALSANQFGESGLRILSGLTLVAFDARPSSMIAGYALGAIGSTAYGILSMNDGLPPTRTASTSIRLRDVLDSLGAGPRALWAINLYAALSVNADVLTAKQYLSAGEAGLYAGATSVARLVLIGASPLIAVVFPRLAALTAGGADTRVVIRGTGGLLVGVLGCSFVVPLLFGPEVLMLFLGKEYMAAERVLQMQWGTACVLAAQSFFAHSLLATGAVRGAGLFVVSALGMLWGFWAFHENAVQIACVSLVACAGPGSLTYLVLWRLRNPPSNRPAPQLLRADRAAREGGDAH